MKFYSQQKEDEFVFKNFINQKNKDGVFLEMGALDGITYSNTKFFEDELEFSGVLIEPIRESFEKLKVNRPNCKNFNTAVSEHVGFVNMMMTNDCATAGIDNVMSDTFKKMWHDSKKTFQKIESSRLDSILHQSEINYIDFWSLDVEGAEYEVLKTMDWNIPVYVLILEMRQDEHSDLVKNDLCREILKNNGLVFHSAEIGFTKGENEVWWNPNYFRKNLLWR